MGGERMVAVVLLAVGVGFVLPGPAAAKFKCAVASKCTDAVAVAEARAAVELACPCAAAATTKAFKQCAAVIVKQRAKDLGPEGFPKPCQKDVKKALANSLCGRPDYVLCRTVNKKGAETCSARPAEKCAEPFAPSTDCAPLATCAEACAPPQCSTTSTLANTTTTTSTTSTTAPPTTSTTSTTLAPGSTTSTTIASTTSTTATLPPSSTTSTTVAPTSTSTLATTSTSTTVTTSTTSTTQQLSPPEVNCSDGADGDGDGFTDCADVDCTWACAALSCQTGERLLAYRATDLPQVVDGLATASSAITVAETGTIATTAMRLHVTHTYTSDVDVSLTPPGGAAHDVTTDNGAGGDDYAGTVFIDGAALNVTAGTAPFAGSFRPEVSFAGYATGTTVVGTWTATVADDFAPTDSGTWTGFSLAFCVQPAVAAEVHCSDGLDGDGDSLADCADADCGWACAALACGPGEALVAYRATDLPQTVDGLAVQTSTIAVPETGTIAATAMTIDLAHSYDDDLDVTLVPPGGAPHDVTTDNGGGGADYAGTVFTDGAAASITEGTAPFTGTFRPEEAFATYATGAVTGTWTASVSDDFQPANDGTWFGFGLAFCMVP